MDTSAIPRKMIWVPSVMIMVGSSWKCVAITPFRLPQRNPTPMQTMICTIRGAPARFAKQAIVPARHTMAPTEISISAMTRMNPIAYIINSSDRYFGISRRTLEKVKLLETIDPKINTAIKITIRPLSQLKTLLLILVFGVASMVLPDFPAMITSPFFPVRLCPSYAVSVR